VLPVEEKTLTHAPSYDSRAAKFILVNNRPINTSTPVCTQFRPSTSSSSRILNTALIIRLFATYRLCISSYFCDIPSRLALFPNSLCRLQPHTSRSFITPHLQLVDSTQRINYSFQLYTIQ